MNELLTLTLWHDEERDLYVATCDDPVRVASAASAPEAMSLLYKELIAALYEALTDMGATSGPISSSESKADS